MIVLNRFQCFSARSVCPTFLPFGARAPKLKKLTARSIFSSHLASAALHEPSRPGAPIMDAACLCDGRQAAACAQLAAIPSLRPALQHPELDAPRSGFRLPMRDQKVAAASHVPRLAAFGLGPTFNGCIFRKRHSCSHLDCSLSWSIAAVVLRDSTKCSSEQFSSSQCENFHWGSDFSRGVKPAKVCGAKTHFLQGRIPGKWN